ncbi:MAG: carboxypeptidase regulatory-like domain-containing protein [Candidatus Brocadia sp. AMX2]|uniref:carboxypeptidase-like regulatory domain-containing protein n=1 Tax=Candidatus Brocadia sinica TaxID=795830 RepID=UPI0009E2E308|nr:carboxypeptidase regulatory-like domain-containing protein [Candidatus Brocadia sp. AMX1]MCE7868681.1 carboxypeptidase regulatory-like domain-containing protein [Candidatus Brocadia sp. AMX2]NOG41723.1 carboxypeptidase regulatory-like domain-containing protein [Planctomycetota bacterium]
MRKKTLSGTEGSFEFTDLETDTYKITAKKRGYRKGRQTVMLEEGEDEEIRIEMKKQLKHKPI